jgi:hypothetical protein
MNVPNSIVVFSHAGTSGPDRNRCPNLTMSLGGHASDGLRVNCYSLPVSNYTLPLRCALDGTIMEQFTLADSPLFPPTGDLAMTYTRGAALALLVGAASLIPLSDASAGCWRWHCGPGIFALPFVVAGAAVAGAAAVATAPLAVVGGPGYYGYGPRPYYYRPYAYYPRPYYYGYGPRGYWAQGGAN